MIVSQNYKSSRSTVHSLIRQAGPADAEQVISGINAICLEGRAFYTKHFVSTPQWDAVLYHPETSPDHLLLVVEWDGRIIGAGRLFPGGKYTLFRHVAELGIFILKPFRRQGFGTQLLTHLMLWATQRSLEKITLVTFSTNLPAIMFFEKHGFVREGRMRHQIKIEEQYVDLLLMGQFLPSASRHTLSVPHDVLRKCPCGWLSADSCNNDISSDNLSIHGGVTGDGSTVRCMVPFPFS